MINTVIAKTSTSKKVVDFRDGLVLAKPDDYAMLFGVGGKKHNPVSVIPVTVCDFSAGTGPKSITCTANLELDTIALLHAVAKDRLLNPVQAPSSHQNQASSQKQTGVMLSEQAWNELVGGLNILRSAMKNPGFIDGDNFVELGKKIRAVYDEGKSYLDNSANQGSQPASAVTYGAPAKKTNADFTHQQVRVHMQRQGQDGLAPNMAPVQKLTITHTAFDDRGAPINYPWIISIANGAAEPKVSDLGGITYKSSTYQEINSVFMNVSDMDMFSMLDACQRFITTFTMTFGIPLVKNGVEQKIREREEWKANNGYGQQARNNNQNNSSGEEPQQSDPKPNGYQPQGGNNGQQRGYQPRGAAQPQPNGGQTQGSYQPRNAPQSNNQQGYRPQGAPQQNNGYQPQGTSQPGQRQGYQPKGNNAPQTGVQYGRPQASGYRPSGYGGAQ